MKNEWVKKNASISLLLAQMFTCNFAAQQQDCTLILPKNWVNSQKRTIESVLLIFFHLAEKALSNHVVVTPNGRYMLNERADPNLSVLRNCRKREREQFQIIANLLTYRKWCVLHSLTILRYHISSINFFRELVTSV